ncbi:retrotransposon protein, putative, ty1-copia subclass [Tanacetum coccineum]
MTWTMVIRGGGVSGKTGKGFGKFGACLGFWRECRIRGFEPPQEEEILIRRSERSRRVPNRLCLNVKADEHSLGDLNEPTSYRAAISIYGLKQASRSWNKRFDKEIKRFGFDQNLDEPCIYQKASGNNVTFLILYVDDIIIMGNHIPSLQSVKDYLGKCFAMKDLGEAAFILGIKIYRDWSKRLIRLGQNGYMDKILKRYKMDNSKRGHIPMQERLELNKTQGASTPKEFQQYPAELHWTAMKNILKYLRNTKDMFLVYGGNPEAKLRVDCYCDTGFETDKDDTKSQTGYVFILNGGVVDWKSSKRSTTAMSATEAESIATLEAVMEAVG